jgi:hypothetical protein
VGGKNRCPGVGGLPGHGKQLLVGHQSILIKGKARSDAALGEGVAELEQVNLIFILGFNSERSRNTSHTQQPIAPLPQFLGEA